MKNQKTRILLVDDHPLVREWLANLIHEQPDLVVCGEAATASKAMELIAANAPDIVVVDLSLRSGSGLDLLKNIKAIKPCTATIVLSMHEESVYAERALRAGARGYVMKREGTGQIVSSIRRVMRRKLAISEAVASSLTERFIDGAPSVSESPLEELSDRELQVFQMLGEGNETRQIAESLNISIKTGQAYCARIKEKLKLTNATELLREAIRWHDSAGKP